MVGGVKAHYAVLLALVLGVGCGQSMEEGDHNSRRQAPPLLEMLPPIGPVGFVLMGVVVEEMGFGTVNVFQELMESH